MKHLYITITYNITSPALVNSSPPGQNGWWHGADDIFKCIFMNEKFCILIWISFKFVPKGPIDSKSVHDDVIKWKHFPSNWPFVQGIHRSPVNSLHKGQWRGALMFSLICVWLKGWVNNREAGDLRRYRAHYDVIVMVGSGNGDTQAKSHYLNQCWCNPLIHICSTRGGELTHWGLFLCLCNTPN